MIGDLLPDVVARPLAIFTVDLLVAGDNALVIALLCRGVPARRLGTMLAAATLGAVALRLALIGLAGALLAWPGMKLLGAALLALIAVRLGVTAPQRRSSPLLTLPGGLVATALLLAAADVLMSFDNVLALAAVAGGSALYLTLGLLGSICVLMFGSAMLARLMAREPWLARLGAALLGWIAGGMAVGDRLVAAWIATQAPALPLVVPLLAAGYVYFAAPGTAGGSPTAPDVAPRAAPRPTPASAPRRPGLRVPAWARAGISLELAVFLALFGTAGLLLGALVMLGGPPIR